MQSILEKKCRYVSAATYFIQSGSTTQADCVIWRVLWVMWWSFNHSKTARKAETASFKDLKSLIKYSR